MDLQNYDFLNTLDQDTLTYLEKHLQPISLPKDYLLFYQGDICEHILLLTSGKVRLYTQANGVEELTLYTLQAGEQCIVNTASLLSKTAAIATAQTTTPIEGYLLSAKSVEKLSNISPAYQRYLFSLYQLRFSDLTNLINDLKFKRLDERILEWLKNQNTLQIETTHENIAIQLSTSRVVVSRVLKELEQHKKVKLHRGKIELLL